MADPVVANVVVAQSAGSQASVTTAGVTTTSGSLFAVAVCSFGNIIGATPVSDNKSNTYTAAVASVGNTEGWTALYYVANGTGGASHTFTFTPTGSGFLAIAAIEIQNIATSSPLNESDGDAGSGSTRTTGPITASAGIREVFVAAGSSSDSNNPSLAIPQPAIGELSNWNFRFNLATGTTEGITIAWRLVQAGESASFTSQTSVADFDSAVIAGFKAADPAPSTGGATSYPFILG